MLNRSGEYVSYPGCIELVKGVFVSDDGDVYIHDGENEIVCWTVDEFLEDPAIAITAAIAGVALAAKQGPGAVRRNLTDKGTTLGLMIKQTMNSQGIFE